MLDFFVNLEPNDLVVLINEAIVYANKNNVTSLRDVAQNVIVYEESCISDDGIILKLVKGISPIGPFHSFGHFYINDFLLLLDEGEMVDCSLVLYPFMVKKFGESYIAFLQNMGIEVPKEEAR